MLTLYYIPGESHLVSSPKIVAAAINNKRFHLMSMVNDIILLYMVNDISYKYPGKCTGMLFEPQMPHYFPCLGYLSV